MTLKVRDVMAKRISTAAPADAVGHVARLMKDEDTGFIPVCDGDLLVGVVTDRDIVLRCLAGGHEDPLGEPIDNVISHSPLTIEADRDIDAAVELTAVSSACSPTETSCRRHAGPTLPSRLRLR